MTHLKLIFFFIFTVIFFKLFFYIFKQIDNYEFLLDYFPFFIIGVVYVSVFFVTIGYCKRTKIKTDFFKDLLFIIFLLFVTTTLFSTVYYHLGIKDILNIKSGNKQTLNFSFPDNSGEKTTLRENYTIENFLYFSLVTITTVGYGDITPVSLKAKFWVSVEIITSIFILMIGVSIIVSRYTSGYSKN